jgi:hypothetical protein
MPDETLRSARYKIAPSMKLPPASRAISAKQALQTTFSTPLFQRLLKMLQEE